MESQNNVPGKDLIQSLKRIQQKGISADIRKLKKDMCTLFSDPREAFRELVTNSYDAKASHVLIAGHKKGDEITIVVTDDGHGMYEQGVNDYFTLFRSHKRSDNVVGQHGVGKLSVAAIPRLKRFSMLTWNREEAWFMETHSLLDDTPINIDPIDPEDFEKKPGFLQGYALLETIRPKLRDSSSLRDGGSQFTITFVAKNSVKEELLKIYNLLQRYVRYLPIVILVAGIDPGPNTPPPMVTNTQLAHGRQSKRTTLPVHPLWKSL